MLKRVSTKKKNIRKEKKRSIWSLRRRSRADKSFPLLRKGEKSSRFFWRREKGEKAGGGGTSKGPKWLGCEKEGTLAAGTCLKKQEQESAVGGGPKSDITSLSEGEKSSLAV